MVLNVHSARLSVFTAMLQFKFLEVECCNEEKTHCSIYGFDGGPRPSCGQKEVRSWGPVWPSAQKERERWALECFLLVFLPQCLFCAYTCGAEDPACKCHICISAIFAWLCVFISRAAGKEARSEPAANTDRQIWIIAHFHKETLIPKLDPRF